MIPLNEGNLQGEDPSPVKKLSWSDRMQMNLDFFQGDTGSSFQGEDSPNTVKELSFIDRLQVTLDSLRKPDTDRNSNSAEAKREPASFIESQLSALRTNVQMLCTELVHDLMLTSGSDDNTEASETDNSPTTTSTPNGGVEKSVKLVDSPMFHLEGSSAVVMPVFITKKVVQPMETQATIEVRMEASLNESSVEDTRAEDLEVLSRTPEQSEHDSRSSKDDSSNSKDDSSSSKHDDASSSKHDDSSSSKWKEEDCEEYAQWFVSEEYRRMRLGKSASTESIKSWDGHQRSESSDSLKDWELV